MIYGETFVGVPADTAYRRFLEEVVPATRLQYSAGAFRRGLLPLGGLVVDRVDDHPAFTHHLELQPWLRLTVFPDLRVGGVLHAFFEPTAPAQARVAFQSNDTRAVTIAALRPLLRVMGAIMRNPLGRAYARIFNSIAYGVYLDGELVLKISDFIERDYVAEGGSPFLSKLVARLTASLHQVISTTSPSR